jgi:propanediol dehydratase small subunit
MPDDDDRIYSKSGRRLDELCIEAVRAGELTAQDFCIQEDTLRRQADVAEAAGYRQLAENLRRAGELTRLSNREILDIYDALRPGRATYGRLVDVAAHLERDLDAPLTAAFVRQAAEVYRERGLVKES